MQVKSQHPRKFVYGVAIGVGSAALVLLLGWSGVLERVELITYDWRMRAAADAYASQMRKQEARRTKDPGPRTD